MIVKTTIGWPMAINKRVLSENYTGRNNMWPIHTHTNKICKHGYTHTHTIRNMKAMSNAMIALCLQPRCWQFAPPGSHFTQNC